MILDLDEYGPARRWAGGTDSLEHLRAESLRWKDALGMHNPPLVIRHSPRGQPLIRAEGVAGFVQTDDVSIEIRPKFLSGCRTGTWRAALWQILVLVEDRPTLGAPAPATSTEQQSLPDLLGWILLDGLRRAALEGLPRGYTEESAWLPVLRGRLNAAELHQVWAHPARVPCVYDVYGHNTPANRLLRWAAHRLTGSVNSTWLARELQDIVGLFLDVDPTPPGTIEADTIRLSLQHEFLGPALQAARLVLRAESLVHGEGALTAPSFLWKSSEVFEQFVRYLLSRVVDGEPGWVLDRPDLLLGVPDRELIFHGPPLRTYPDYRLHRRGTSSVVLDAKYKQWAQADQPRSSDTYQMLAAGRVSGASHVVLVYPQLTPSPKGPMRWRMRGEKFPSWLCCLFVDLAMMGSEGGEERLVKQLRADLQVVLG